MYLSRYTQTYNEKGLAQSKLWEPGTLCITIAANIAETAILAVRGCFPDSVVGFVANPDKCDVKFVKYYIDTIKLQMQNVSKGTTQDNLSLDKLLTFDFLVPPPSTQRKITAVLSAYDDLIENNTRRIEILEEMARAIYREWFVHFRFPGHEKVRMVDSLLGPIPEGWEATELGEVAQQVRRNVKPEQIDPGIPYVGLEHIPRNTIALSDWGTVGEVQSSKLIFEKGEILFGKIRPYFHKVAVAPMDGVCSSDTIVISSKADGHFSLVLSLVSSEEFVNHATQTSQGTKMPRADWNVLVEYPVAIPPYSLLQRFDEFIRDIVRQIQNLIFRNKNLRRTRDLLLPKLISGEVRP
jgi:type I restriction enzyme S subunit